MKPTRRTVLKSLAASAAALRLPSASAQAQPFPTQDVIDNDPLRPRYHLMPRRGWMNDPCAPLYVKGTYHLFYQYNPGASVWGDMHWAHSTSPDMIHWTPRPIAFAPTPDSPDGYGVWTGSAVLDPSRDGGVPTILYTATSFSSRELATMKDATPHPIREQVMLATPADKSLDSWRKLPAPVLTGPPSGMEVTGFRDPVPFRIGDSWYLLMASGELGKGGDVLLYKSPDLRQWTFQHIFAQGKPTGKKTPDTVDSGEMWECPDFFPLGDKHVLIHSTGTPDGRATLWQSGRLDPKTMRWTPENEGILNHGPYYAPKTQTDAKGQRILWGWIPEDRPEAEFARAGWAGCMSLPRILTLQNGQVRFRIAPESASLRKGPLAAGTLSRQAEYLLRLERHAGAPALSVNAGPIALASSISDEVTCSGRTVQLREPLPERLDLRIFVDHSVVEMFLADRLVFTARTYTSQAVSLTLPPGYRIAKTEAWQLSL